MPTHAHPTAAGCPGQKDGFNVIYHLNDLGFPFIYSSVFTNSRTLKEKPMLVQRFVAGLAETVYFVEKNPQQAMAAVGKTLSIKIRRSFDPPMTPMC
jgi:ABC-type nitrate/sulfonate/bicarbonate transport system substrate-binding protein